MTNLQTRGDVLGTYIAKASNRPVPDIVLHEARRALVDSLGVGIAAVRDPAVRPVHTTAKSWNAQGTARIFLGERTTPALAALVNATAIHAMDFDDVHYLGAGHPSGPCWATALAVGEHIGADEALVLRAFITGYEIMARLGGGGVPGVGRSLQRTGFHPTSILGRMGAAAVAAVLYGLDATQAQHALSCAATTAGGLLGSFGTHGKPFHAGKAAMDGILAADLAQNGFLGSTRLYETEGGWLDAFLAGQAVAVPPLDFETRWELLRNGYKLLASCRGTHASAQTARAIFPRLKGRAIRQVVASIHPGALVTAGIDTPRSPLEAKFSIRFCIAMALSGYTLAASDFTPSLTQDPTLSALLPLIHLQPVEGQSPASAHIRVTLDDSTVVEEHTDVIVGHPDNPANDDILNDKFLNLVGPVVGERKAHALAHTAWNFGQPGTLTTLGQLLGDSTENPGTSAPP